MKKAYILDVARNHPSRNPQIAEEKRLRRILREETSLCPYAASNLQPEHFFAYREKRLQIPSPGKARENIAPGPVKRELTLLKRVIDHKSRKLGLPFSPVNTIDVPRPAVNDERNVRLAPEHLKLLIRECYQARNELLGPVVEFVLETGARQSNVLRLRWRDIDLEEPASTCLTLSRQLGYPTTPA